MNLLELFAKVSASLDALEAAIAAVDFTPQLTEIDTRIVALTGQLQAKIGTQTPPQG